MAPLRLSIRDDLRGLSFWNRRVLLPRIARKTRVDTAAYAFAGCMRAKSFAREAGRICDCLAAQTLRRIATR